MKTFFSSKTLIALAVAVAATAGYKSLASEQPIPPPSSDSVLPANIQPGSPVAQVVKLVQAGVDTGVIQTYISNCPSAFNLDADKIISLTDAGLSSDLVNAMFAHDKNYLSSLNNPAPPAPAAPTPAAADNSPPAAPQEVTVNNFYQDLAPYGSWVTIDGYGRCWRPNIVVYDSGWRPYCDRGQWVYTDCGWYWNSDYSWGATFHYGRWFCDAHQGWCWWPDTVWAPSWVTWRSCNDYCGWAPLPPYTAYQTGIGFTYRGNNVGVSFDFGLAANCFTFITVGNFCEHHPRNFCAPPQQVTQIFNRTTIINNFNSHNRTIVNNGVSVTVIGNGGHHPIQAVPIGSLVNGGRHGGNNNAARHFGADASDNSATRNLAGTGLRHGPVLQNNNGGQDSRTVHSNSDVATARPPSFRTTFTPVPAMSAHNSGAATAVHPPTTQPTAQHPQQNGNQFATRDFGSISRPVQTVTTPARNNWTAPDNSRPSQQPVRTFAAPVAVERPQANQPVMSTDRPQHSEPRQNYVQPVQSAPRYVAPGTPAMSQSASGQSQGQSQNNGNQYQGWAMHNH